jgi:hypothetical protein
MATDDADLPKLAAPARRALIGAGYTRLEQLTEVEESEVMRLHGMGPNAMETLRNALAERGLSFRGGMVGPA